VARAPALGYKRALFSPSSRFRSNDTPMKPEETHDSIVDAGGGDDALKSRRGRLVAVYISLLAVVLAVGALGGSNATKDVINNNIAASNLFAFFQAKNIRQNAHKLALDHLAAVIATDKGLAEDARRRVEALIARYRATVARLESEPATREGKRELLARARAYERARDRAQAKDPYFDYSQALLQIAIVVASASLVIGSAYLLWVSMGLGLFGLLLLADAFTLAVRIGFLEG
jgi:hypothetical protein